MNRVECRRRRIILATFRPFWSSNSVAAALSPRDYVVAQPKCRALGCRGDHLPHSVPGDLRPIPSYAWTSIDSASHRLRSALVLLPFLPRHYSEAESLVEAPANTRAPSGRCYLTSTNSRPALLGLQ